MSLPKTWQRLPPDALVSAEASRETGVVREGQWWHVFQDAHLDKLIDAALQVNLSVAAAAERLRAARALSGAPQPPYGPELTASTAVASTPDARTSYFQLGFDARWELPLFDRAANARRVVDAQLGEASADLAAVRSSVVAEVACAYFAIQSTARQAVLLHELDELERSNLQRISSRVRAGLESPGTLDAEQTERLSVQMKAAEPGVLHAQSLHQIAALLGQSTVDPAWESDRELAVPAALRIETAPADLLRTRPDVRSAEAAVLKAAASLGIAQADLYPHVSLLGFLTAAVRIGGGGIAGSSGALAAAPAISIPLFDWGMRRAARDARAAELSAAVLQYRQVVLEAVSDVESALAALNGSIGTVELLRHSVELHKESARVGEALQRAGLSEEGTHSVARAAIEARLSLVNAEYEASRSVVQLYKALGGADIATHS